MFGSLLADAIPLFFFFSLLSFFFIEPAALRPVVLQYVCAPAASRKYLATVCFLSCFVYFCFFGDVCFSFFMESALYVLLPVTVCLPRDHGLDFDISLLCDNSIKQSINQEESSRMCAPETIS